MPRLSPSELAHRKLGLGSTDVVEALGLSPYDGHGPVRLYLDKTSDATESDYDDRAELEWGHVQEPIILAWYERETGRRTLPGGMVPHPEYTWLWASIDATVLGGDRGVEIKNVGANMCKHWDAYVEDGVPRYVRAQVTVAMACTGRRLWDVCASLGGRPPHVWTVAYDEELATILIDGARDFWARCVARNPPDLDYTPASKELVRRLYPTNEDRVIVDAPAKVDAWGTARAKYARVIKESKRKIDELDARILEACAEHSGIRGEGWQMTWKAGKAGKDGTRKQRFTSFGGDDGEREE